jgi:predicted dehydrogenase
VTTRDCFHDEFIVRGLNAGCNVITEKPMTTTAGKCQRIVDTVKRTGRSLRVTFNYRYSPPRTQVKRMLQDGIIGRVLSIEFKWLLDTRHGADYFRRWHRNKANSGGLMVHKATHHFDLVNWWINSVPAKVAATGRRGFYTPEQAQRYGLTKRGERCLDCAESRRCPFYLDLREGLLKTLYLDNEKYDGYRRDGCVFSDRIDIEDTMNVAVEYASGVRMSYCLNTFSPWEGYHAVFNGTRGRLEHVSRESSYISGDGSVPGQTIAGTTITVMPHFTRGYPVQVDEGVGGHGGGDTRLLDDLFGRKPAPDPLGLRADYRGGAYSILTGVAANISMAEGRVVTISDLVHGVDMPDYPATPEWDAPINIRRLRPPAFVRRYQVSDVLRKRGPVTGVKLPPASTAYKPLKADATGLANVWQFTEDTPGVIYFKATCKARKAGKANIFFGADGPCRIWLNGKPAAVYTDLTNPAVADRFTIPVSVRKGANDIVVAMDTNEGRAWGIFLRLK